MITLKASQFLFLLFVFAVSNSAMHMIMSQEDKMRTPTFQFQSPSTYFLILALKAASVLFVLILCCLTVDFSEFSVLFPSFNLGRTHMFLICNGIVLILVKGSVLAAPYEPGAADHHIRRNYVEKVEMGCEVIIEGEHVGRDVVVLGVQEEEDEMKSTIGCVLIAEEAPQIDQQLVEVEYEDNNDGFDSFEELSIEELNKKCDEFIKKMRQVICDDRQ